MAITKLNSLAIPPDTVVESDISFPLDSASFTGDLTVDTDTLVVDSTNDLVGINVAAPADNFHVRVSDATLAAPNSRSVALFERNADAAITIGSNAANKGIIYFADSASATDGQIFYDHANQTMSIGTAGAIDRVVVKNNGDVGIGRSDPTRRFHARGSEQVVGHFESTSTTRAVLTVSDANTSADSYVGMGAKGDNLELRSGNNTKITVTDGGDVGIGTQGPATVRAGNVLQFESTTGTEFIAFRQDAGLVSGDYIGGYIFGSNDSSGTPNHYTGMWATADDVYGTMTLNFGTGRESYETNTPQIVMSGGGNLGVNYTLPDVPLCVGVDAGNTLAARFGTLGSAKAGDDVFVRLQGQNSSNTNKYFDIRHLIDDGALTINGPTSTLTEILRIDADGIKFGGETNAAHALDDYEEGNWLPTPKDNSGNAATFTTRVGYYVKIGRLVYVTVDLVNINTTGCTSTDAVLIKGLPFTPVSGGGNTYHTGIASVGGGIATSENVIGVRITENVDYIVMAKGSQGLMGDLVKFQDMFSGSSDIRFSMSYYTAA